MIQSLSVEQQRVSLQYRCRSRSSKNAQEDPGGVRVSVLSGSQVIRFSLLGLDKRERSTDKGKRLSDDIPMMAW